MNILKAFKEERYMDLAFDNCVQQAGKYREISLSNRTVTTVGYDKVYFRTIDTLEKAYQLGGICFQVVDYCGFADFTYNIDEQISNYLNSRIRG